MSDYPIRPATPQAMLHRLPDKPDSSSQDNNRPSKYIILIQAPTSTAGKVHIAKSISTTLSCPLLQGDSLHETSAKAASVGTAKLNNQENAPNEARYQRMWLSKMTRTGLLFPEESRPATEGFSGFGGTKSSSTSRRGSVSSVEMGSSDAEGSVASYSSTSSFMGSGSTPVMKFVNKPPKFTTPEEERKRKGNAALMVLTHPYLEKWHKDCIRKAVEEYGIGVIFVPLYEDEDGELPILKPLDPRTMTSFGPMKASFGGIGGGGRSLDEEIVLRVDVEGNVEEIIEEIVSGVREIMAV